MRYTVRRYPIILQAYVSPDVNGNYTCSELTRKNERKSRREDAIWEWSVLARLVIVPRRC